jgi:hypothetical protein
LRFERNQNELWTGIKAIQVPTPVRLKDAIKDKRQEVPEEERI